MRSSTMVWRGFVLQSAMPESMAQSLTLCADVDSKLYFRHPVSQRREDEGKETTHRKDREGREEKGRNSEEHGTHIGKYSNDHYWRQ